jgi:RNA polymerase sigma-70 factor (ECF subfamily)
LVSSEELIHSPEDPMTDFQDELIEQLPYLTAFARKLTRDRARADDLVQETALRALCNVDKFEPGTNFRAWLSTILRNQFYNEIRANARSSAYDEAGVYAPVAAQLPTQESRLEMRDFERAFAKLPVAQREALNLVGVSGLSYEEAAAVAGCPDGTMKSRVCRARSSLEGMLGRDLPGSGIANDNMTPVAA